MSVETREWATRESVHELAVDLARLETKVGESDKRLATKEDLVAVREDVAVVRSDIRVLRILIIVGWVVSGLTLVIPDDVNLVTLLRLLSGG